MANPERSFAKKAVELSKKVDRYMIIGGTGIYFLVSPAVGVAVILGSVLTIIPANLIGKWLERRKAKKQMK